MNLDEAWLTENRYGGCGLLTSLTPTALHADLERATLSKGKARKIRM